MAVKGIDVSKYQGNIDWAAVKNSVIEVAMLRGGYGLVCTCVFKGQRRRGICQRSYILRRAVYPAGRAESSARFAYMP